MTGREAVSDKESTPLSMGLAGTVDVRNLVEVFWTVLRPSAAGFPCAGSLMALLTGLLMVFPVGGVLASGGDEPAAACCGCNGELSDFEAGGEYGLEESPLDKPGVLPSPNRLSALPLDGGEFALDEPP